MIRRLRAILVLTCAAAAVACGAIAVVCRARIVTLAHLAREDQAHYFLVADRGRLVAARQSVRPPTSGTFDVSRYATMAVKDFSFTDPKTGTTVGGITGMMTIDFAGAAPFFSFRNTVSGGASLPVAIAAVGAPAWVVALLLATPPVASIALRVRRRRRMRPGCCPHCGYDLRATPDRCPECGRAGASA
jgi:hypothetical protein